MPKSFEQFGPPSKTKRDQVREETREQVRNRPAPSARSKTVSNDTPASQPAMRKARLGEGAAAQAINQVRRATQRNDELARKIMDADKRNEIERF